jgi:hypothetical protein
MRVHICASHLRLVILAPLAKQDEYDEVAKAAHDSGGGGGAYCALCIWRLRPSNARNVA